MRSAAMYTNRACSATIAHPVRIWSKMLGGIWILLAMPARLRRTEYCLFVPSARRQQQPRQRMFQDMDGGKIFVDGDVLVGRVIEPRVARPIGQDRAAPGRTGQ